MSDVPNQGAQSLQTGNQTVLKGVNIDPRDIEDIDRELEAYLEEKRSGKKINFDRSVDSQLSDLREKFSMRVTPTKESQKPLEVEEVKRSPLDSEPRFPVPPQEPKTETISPTKDSQVSKPLSHEELIRSLEEKYSTGTTPNGPPTKQNEKISTPTPPHIPTSNKPAQPVVELDEAIPPKEINSKLADLKESIDPRNSEHINALLVEASTLEPHIQESLIDTFLMRFRRNKERKELFLQTQVELESEFEKFIRSQKEKSGVNPAPESPSSQKLTETLDSNEQASTPIVDKNVVPSVESNISKSQAERAEVQTIAKPAPSNPQIEQKAPENNISVEEKYKAYLARLEKKPTVLLYDPEKGFIRKNVDPSDKTLSFSYSIEDSTNSAVLLVFDAKGNEIGVFKTPLSELSN